MILGTNICLFGWLLVPPVGDNVICILTDSEHRLVSVLLILNTEFLSMNVASYENCEII